MSRPWTLLALFLFAVPAVAQTPEELYRAGSQALAGGDAYAAIDLLGRLAQQDPEYRDVQLLLGQSQLVVGGHREAKRHFEAVLAKDPQNGLATFLLGFSLHQAARHNEALEVLDRAVDLAPGNPNPHVYRGLSLLAIGRPGEARAALEQALGLAPQDAAARAAMAQLELAEGDAPGAAGRLEAVVREVPSAENRILLARAYLEGGQPAEAVPLLRQLDDELPGRSDVLYLLAQSLLRSGDAEGGSRAMERFKAQRATEERLRVLEAEVSTDPQNTSTRLELVELLLDDEQPGRARLHLATLARQLPGDRRVEALLRRLAQQRP
jgi:predicted Zn-dependent protease